jgi:hypothetical protein
MFRSLRNVLCGGLAHRCADKLADLYHHWSTSDDEAKAERNGAAKHRLAVYRERDGGSAEEWLNYFSESARCPPEGGHYR